jgi:hypothetical protein
MFDRASLLNGSGACPSQIDVVFKRFDLLPVVFPYQKDLGILLK